MVELCIISILRLPFVWWCSSLSANPSRFIGLRVAAFLRLGLFGPHPVQADGWLLIKKACSAFWSTQPVQTGGCGADTYLRELSVFLRGECVGTDRLVWTEMDVQVGASEWVRTICAGGPVAMVMSALWVKREQNYRAEERRSEGAGRRWPDVRPMFSLPVFGSTET